MSVGAVVPSVVAGIAGVAGLVWLGVVAFRWRSRAHRVGSSVGLDQLRCGANRQHGSLWVGGFLTADAEHLWFRPHWFERLLRRPAVDIDWDDVASIESVGCMPSLTGGIASCVELRLVDGSIERFRVWRASERAMVLAGFHASARREDAP